MLFVLRLLLFGPVVILTAFILVYVGRAGHFVLVIIDTLDTCGSKERILTVL